MQQLFGLAPAQTGIGNGDAVKERNPFFPRLSAGIEVAFDHQAHDGLAAFAKLPQAIMRDVALARVVFIAKPLLSC